MPNWQEDFFLTLQNIYGIILPLKFKHLSNKQERMIPYTTDVNQKVNKMHEVKFGKYHSYEWSEYQIMTSTSRMCLWLCAVYR